MNQDDFNKVFGGDLIKRTRPVKMGPTFTNIEKHHGSSKEKNPSKEKTTS